MVVVADPTISFTDHAMTVITERGISPEWIRRVLDHPDWLEVDVVQDGVRLAFGRIAERDNRILRVVYYEGQGYRRIITAFFDRGRMRLVRKGQR